MRLVNSCGALCGSEEHWRVFGSAATGVKRLVLVIEDGPDHDQIGCSTPAVNLELEYLEASESKRPISAFAKSLASPR